VFTSEETLRLESNISSLMTSRQTIDGYSRDQVEYQYAAGETLCHLTAQYAMQMIATDQFFGSSTENVTSQYSRQYSLPTFNKSPLPHSKKKKNPISNSSHRKL
jgi:hypothetical protein